MSGKWISLLLLSLTAAAPASGGNQSRPLNMETLSVVDGLSSNYVYAITQDRAGYMWFGTENGLDRYDGKTIRHYQHFPDNPQSLSDSRVNCLLSSADGSLLVGTEKGINIYAEIFCIYRVKSMLRINKCSLATELLRLCHNVQRKCGFTR